MLSSFQEFKKLSRIECSGFPFGGWNALLNLIDQRVWPELKDFVIKEPSMYNLSEWDMCTTLSKLEEVSKENKISFRYDQPSPGYN